MKTYEVIFTEEVAYKVTILAPNQEEVHKRFKEGNFPFTEGKEVGADSKIYSCDEVVKPKYNLSQGDPL